MSGISSLFVDPSEIVSGFPGSVQLLFLICVYGYILYVSAKLIADGSELLSVVLDPGLVGGLLLPVMGAVPDCAIVLFSGLGDDAQNQLKVGVGTLAGSTIMLLTLPWFACAFVGRVDVVDDSANNDSALLLKGKKGKGGLSCSYLSTPKLTPGLSFWDTVAKTGVQPPATVKGSALIMICSALGYLIIQGPAFALSKDSTSDAAKAENTWALAGLIVSSLMFATFSAYCVFSASAIELQKARLIASRKEAVNRKLVSMVSLLRIEEDLNKDDASSTAASDDILKSLFSKYDLDGNGTLDVTEVKNMLQSLSIRITSSEIKTMMEEYGGDDKLINETEFVGLAKSVASRQTIQETGGVIVKEHGALQSGGGEEENVDDDDDEEEEDEEDSGNLTKFQILTRSCGTLLLGVGMCVVFSDPMVDALTELGNRWGISPFYISFIITPVVSNASELLSSLQFAAKKTRRSIDMTYQQLLGASTMNNTLCLSVFLVLVYARKLAWEFSAEVLTILTVEIVVFAVTYSSKNSVLPLWKAAIPLLCFPLSLVMVWVLENELGLD
jgi:Ca2+/Na+ antiporter